MEYMNVRLWTGPIILVFACFWNSPVFHRLSFCGTISKLWQRDRQRNLLTTILPDEKGNHLLGSFAHWLTGSITFVHLTSGYDFQPLLLNQMQQLKGCTCGFFLADFPLLHGGDARV